MAAMNPYVHGNYETGNCDLTVFSTAKQGAIKIIGTYE